jgi:hypothetical protein
MLPLRGSATLFKDESERGGAARAGVPRRRRSLGTRRNRFQHRDHDGPTLFDPQGD